MRKKRLIKRALRFRDELSSIQKTPVKRKIVTLYSWKDNNIQFKRGASDGNYM